MDFYTYSSQMVKKTIELTFAKDQTGLRLFWSRKPERARRSIFSTALIKVISCLFPSLYHLIDASA